MHEFKPPAPYTNTSSYSVFLAGSIEQGIADNWQATVKAALADLTVDILNPRRDEWDSSWEQSITNPQFAEQVTWELNHLERGLLTSATAVFFYIDPATKSPITLAEFGAVYRDSNIIICCPEGFWRRGNLEVMCARAGLLLHGDLDQAIHVLRSWITKSQFT